MEDKDKITYFAETDHRHRTPFGIKAEDRARHVYTIGKTGMGKSTLLENMAIQDIQNGNGICFVDPHGKTADFLLDFVPKHRIKDVIYFAPFDMENPLSFNIMEDVGYDKRHLVANGLMSAFKKIWVDAWSARMEYILSNVIMALLEYPGSTLLGVNRMLVDKAYRKKVVDNIKDPSVKSFWVDEFAKYSDRYTQDATPAIQNKVGQFTANPLIRNIIGQPESSFDLRKVMDEKKILIINLSKGQIGEGNANLLGSMMITKLYLSAMSRADLSGPELEKRPNFYLFVDEFQSFANESFADILSEARKYKLNLTIAHQYIEQMPEEVRSAVFGNVGTMIVFRVGAYDADLLEKEFAPKFYAEDLVNLGFAQTYLKLMINGVTSQPFSARTLPPVKPSDIGSRDAVIASSRALYSVPRKTVEDNINSWYGDTREATPNKKGETGKVAERVISTPEQIADSKKKKLAALKKSKEVVKVPLDSSSKKQKEPVKGVEAQKGVDDKKNTENKKESLDKDVSVNTIASVEKKEEHVVTYRSEASKNILEKAAAYLDENKTENIKLDKKDLGDTDNAHGSRSGDSNMSKSQKLDDKASQLLKENRDNTPKENKVSQGSSGRVSPIESNNQYGNQARKRNALNNVKESDRRSYKKDSINSHRDGGHDNELEKDQRKSGLVLDDLRNEAVAKDKEAYQKKQEEENKNGLKDALRLLLEKEVNEKVHENSSDDKTENSHKADSSLNFSKKKVQNKLGEKTMPLPRQKQKRDFVGKNVTSHKEVLDIGKESDINVFDGNNGSKPPIVKDTTKIPDNKPAEKENSTLFVKGSKEGSVKHDNNSAIQKQRGDRPVFNSQNNTAIPNKKQVDVNINISSDKKADIYVGDDDHSEYVASTASILNPQNTHNTQAVNSNNAEHVQKGGNEQQIEKNEKPLLNQTSDKVTVNQTTNSDHYKQKNNRRIFDVAPTAPILNQQKQHNTPSVNSDNVEHIQKQEVEQQRETPLMAQTLDNTTVNQVTNSDQYKQKSNGQMFNGRKPSISSSKNEVPENVLKNVLGID